MAVSIYFEDVTSGGNYFGLAGAGLHAPGMGPSVKQESFGWSPSNQHAYSAA
jgi:hypothetical protein